MRTTQKELKSLANIAGLDFFKYADLLILERDTKAVFYSKSFKVIKAFLIDLNHKKEQKKREKEIQKGLILRADFFAKEKAVLKEPSLFDEIGL